MLAVQKVSLSFRGVRALVGVDLDVTRGELLGIIGPNGSGKSTLFNVITGIYVPDAGEIRLEDASLVGQTPAQIVRRGIARTFQNKRLFGTMTAVENVMVAALKGQPGSVGGDVLGLGASRAGLVGAEEAAGRCLDVVGLTPWAETLAQDLPYGAQNRLEVARALALEPRLLLLDEPAAGLNPAERREVRDLVGRIHGMGITIAMVEHDVRMVVGICSRVIVLDHGEKIADGSPTEAVRDRRVIEAYFGTAEIHAGDAR